MPTNLDPARVWNAYERLVPEFTHPIEYSEHIARYRFAAQFTGGRNVLDLGCGVGYGAASLSASATSVVALDVSPDAIRYANAKYGAANLAFLEASACDIPLADAAVEVVISFEVIEHIQDKYLYLTEIRRVLAPGGVALLSTPHRGAKNHNPHHAEELSLEEFEAALRPHFSRVEMYGQGTTSAIKERIQRWNRPRRLADRLDPLNVKAALRLVFPASARKMITTFVNDLCTGTSLRDMPCSADDFPIGKQYVDARQTLVAVCTK